LESKHNILTLMKDARSFLTVLLKTSTWELHCGWGFSHFHVPDIEELE